MRFVTNVTYNGILSVTQHTGSYTYSLHMYMKKPIPFKKLFLLFIVVCMGTRLLMSYIAKSIRGKYLQLMGYLMAVPAFGFAYIYMTGSRNKGRFGQKAWWNDLRPIHAVLYGLFAWNAINKRSNSWMFLFADAIFGLISFLIHYYSNGDIQKMYA
jgi:hypothetical protein